MPEAQYLANAQKASEIIDYYTMGQAASAVLMQAQLSACECDLVDIISNCSAMYSGIQSENNDGYSRTFTNQKELNTGIKTVLKTHLTFPENLLSLSGWAFV